MVSFLTIDHLCYFQVTERNEFRAEIKRFHLKGKTPKEIKAKKNMARMPQPLEPFVIVNNEVRRVMSAARGRSLVLSAPKLINKIRDMVMSDRRVTRIPWLSACNLE